MEMFPVWEGGLPPAPPPLASCCQNLVLRPGLPLRPPAGLLPVGLDRTWTPPTMGISSPALPLMWLLAVLSFIVICLCNFCRLG